MRWLKERSKKGKGFLAVDPCRSSQTSEHLRDAPAGQYSSYDLSSSCTAHLRHDNPPAVQISKSHETMPALFSSSFSNGGALQDSLVSECLFIDACPACPDILIPADLVVALKPFHQRKHICPTK